MMFAREIRQAVDYADDADNIIRCEATENDVILIWVAVFLALRW